MTIELTNELELTVQLDFVEVRTFINRKRSLKKNGVFGFKLVRTLTLEENTIPLLIRKCVEEIEQRGIDVEGNVLYLVKHIRP